MRYISGENLNDLAFFLRRDLNSRKIFMLADNYLPFEKKLYIFMIRLTYLK